MAASGSDWGEEVQNVGKSGVDCMTSLPHWQRSEMVIKRVLIGRRGGLKKISAARVLWRGGAEAVERRAWLEEAS